MSEDKVQEFIDRLVADAGLRERFRSDPVEAAEQHGIELDDDKRERLSSEDWTAISDEEFQARLRGKDWGFWF